MLILPIHTAIIRAGDDLASLLMRTAQIERGDIVVISSKAIATAEGAAVDLSTMTASHDARRWAEKTGRSAEFCQAVLNETLRMNGRILSAVPGALLTDVQGVLVPNAGLDESNIEDGFAVGWPVDPVSSAKKMSDALHAPVIISDSFIIPKRSGVSAFALAVCGMDPVKNEIGTLDLFGHPLTVTTEAVADQMAVGANAVMGNAGQSNPAAIIRDSHIPLSSFCGAVPAIDPEKDLFQDMIS